MGALIVTTGIGISQGRMPIPHRPWKAVHPDDNHSDSDLTIHRPLPADWSERTADMGKRLLEQDAVAARHLALHRR